MPTAPHAPPPPARSLHRRHLLPDELREAGGLRAHDLLEPAPEARDGAVEHRRVLLVRGDEVAVVEDPRLDLAHVVLEVLDARRRELGLARAARLREVRRRERRDPTEHRRRDRRLPPRRRRRDARRQRAQHDLRADREVERPARRARCGRGASAGPEGASGRGAHTSYPVIRELLLRVFQRGLEPLADGALAGLEHGTGDQRDGRHGWMSANIRMGRIYPGIGELKLQE